MWFVVCDVCADVLVDIYRNYTKKSLRHLMMQLITFLGFFCKHTLTYNTELSKLFSVNM